MTRKKYLFALIGIGYVTFFNSLFNGFVYDDAFQIVNNFNVHQGNFFYYFFHTTGENPHYRPLMFLIFTALFKSVGLNAFFFHITQLTFHIVNGILVFWLFHRFSKRLLLSFSLALIFLIHPLNAETVIYISNLQDVLFVFFGLSAFVIGIAKPFRYSYISTTILLFLSLLAKETGILFVIIYGIYGIFFSKQRTEKLTTGITVTGSLLIYVSLRLITLGNRATDITTYGDALPNTITAASLGERLLTIPQIVYFYLTTFIFPFNLVEQYWYVHLPSFSNFLWPLFIGLVIFCTFFYRGICLQKRHINRAHYFWFFYLWFILGMLFHMNIIPLDKTVAARWFYFPMIGLLGMLLFSLSTIKIKGQQHKNLILVSFIILVMLLSLRTMIRNTNWYSNLTLFSHDIQFVQDNPNMHYNYGTALLNDGQYEEAIIHLTKATMLAPNNYHSWHNLGIAYLHVNKITKAHDSFTKELTLHNDSPEVYRSLVYTTLVQEKPKEAKELAETACRKWGNDPYLWRMLGVAAYQLNQNELAEQAFEKSFELLPDTTIKYYRSQFMKQQPIVLREL